MGKAPSLPTLLIITDLVITGVWLKKHLKHLFFIIQEKSPEDALERLKNTVVNMIIIDGHLKDLHVPSPLTQIKKATSPERLPLLLITDNIKKSYQDRLRKAGITDFLNDPLEDEEVQSRVPNAMKTSERQKKVLGLSEVLKESKHQLSENVLSSKFMLSDKAIRELARAKKEKKPLIMALIAIDSYRELEERFGTLGIDKILLFFSKIITQFIRPKDILIPNKEGKFILIMPDTEEEPAQIIAEAIQNRLKEKSLNSSKGRLFLSSSIVLSSYNEKTKMQTESQFDKMLDLANSALKKTNKTSQIISITKRSF
jgi:diguanylate cyclase (GGDEF)-like protein